ncbi:MAG: ribosomal protein S18-alanine N-acetyltransferase [Proteobacteria bacterium]|nr:ribosomal protein S18-alanine N-acetyltransferase [Pseudomonadota bacterium]
MMKIHYNKMQISDLDEVMAIELANYPVAWSKGVMKDCINSGYQCIVIKQQENIIGYAFLLACSDESHLLNMSIKQNLQGKGYGKKLLKYLVNICHYHQSKKFILEVRQSSPIAYSLYKSLGFEEIGIRKNYYRTINGREDAIVMAKKLQD